MCTATNDNNSASRLDWVPTSCTLPTPERPARSAEFDELFCTSVRGLNRVNRTTLDLFLDASARERAADLAARETSCCSFFTFDLTNASGDQIRMRVAVPAAHAAVLDAIDVRAAHAADLISAAG